MFLSGASITAELKVGALAWKFHPCIIYGEWGVTFNAYKIWLGYSCACLCYIVGHIFALYSTV